MKKGQLLKAGRSVYIRVNPMDCMSVVDVLKQIDVLPMGMSFAQGVSIALASCLEGLRQAKVIPEHDGFDFDSIMAPFPPDRKADRGRKLAITKVIRGGGRAFRTPSILPETPARQRLRRRVDELKFKLENDPLNWTPELQKEFEDKLSELEFPAEQPPDSASA